MEVDEKYHPKIIGRKGNVISGIRKNHDVNIQFPDKGSENPSLISITGYQQNAEAARDEILKIVKSYVSTTVLDLFIVLIQLCFLKKVS